MTVTIVKADEEIVIDVDLDKEIPCDFSNSKCDRPAEWRMIRKCCGYHEQKCTVHKDATINMITHIYGVLGCALCGTIRIMPKVSDVYSHIGRL